jgi:hypothetical protein
MFRSGWREWESSYKLYIGFLKASCEICCWYVRTKEKKNRVNENGENNINERLLY